MSEMTERVSRETKVDELTVLKVIGAMRGPTPKMLEMANHVFAIRIWQTMLDEALGVDDRLSDERAYKSWKDTP